MIFGAALLGTILPAAALASCNTNTVTNDANGCRPGTSLQGGICLVCSDAAAAAATNPTPSTTAPQPPAAPTAPTPIIVGSPTKLTNPLGGNATIQGVIGNAIGIFTGVIGSLALLMFVWGGFLWLTSAGNSDQVTKGKNTMIWAAIGLITIFSAYAILSTIFSAIGANPSA